MPGSNREAREQPQAPSAPAPRPAPDPAPAERPLDLSVVLPAFNEAANVAATTEAVVQALTALGGRFEVIVVDDGSSDGTDRVAEEMARADDRVRVVRHACNRGYGTALRSGFQAASFPWIFFTDADGQFDPDELRNLLPLATAADIVAGYRRRRRDPWYRRVYGLAFSHILVRLVMGLRARDPNCAFKLVRRELVQGLDLKAEGALINVELLGKATRVGARVVQVGVPHRPRTRGRATGGSLRVIRQALRELRTVRREIRAAGPKMAR